MVMGSRAPTYSDDSAPSPIMCEISDSKAASAPGGFAFVPHAPLSWAAIVVVEPGGEQHVLAFTQSDRGDSPLKGVIGAPLHNKCNRLLRW
jgi:hypothetical protein